MSHAYSLAFAGRPCRLDSRAATIHRGEYEGLPGDKFAVIVPGDVMRPTLVIPWENVAREMDYGAGEFRSNEVDLGFVRKAR